MSDVIIPTIMLLCYTYYCYRAFSLLFTMRDRISHAKPLHGLQDTTKIIFKDNIQRNIQFQCKTLLAKQLAYKHTRKTPISSNTINY